MRTKMFYGVIFFILLFLNTFSRQAIAMGLGHLLCSIEYTPTMETIEGIPVNQIDGSWSETIVLTNDNFTSCLDLGKLPFLDEEEKKIAANMKKYGYEFSREGDFNNDGIKDKALVGVYRDKSGKIGNFLLVITESAPQKWRKDFLVKLPSEKLAKTYFCFFSVLTGRRYNLVQWSSCMNCDIYYILTWNNGKYNLEYSGDFLPKEGEK